MKRWMRSCAAMGIASALLAGGCGEKPKDTPPPKPPSPAAEHPPGTSADGAAAAPASAPSVLLDSPLANDPHAGLMITKNDPHAGLTMPPTGQIPPPAPPPTGKQLQFTRPDAWTEEAPGQMRIAQYRVPRAEGDTDDAQVAVTFFPEMRGMTQMNVQRWISQFTQPDGKDSKDVAKINEMDVNGMKVTVVQITGTMRSMMGGGQSENYAMFAAEIDTPDGPYFVKFTGPAKTVAANEAAFDAFIKSARVP